MQQNRFLKSFWVAVMEFSLSHRLPETLFFGLYVNMYVSLGCQIELNPSTASQAFLAMVLAATSSRLSQVGLRCCRSKESMPCGRQARCQVNCGAVLTQTLMDSILEKLGVREEPCLRVGGVGAVPLRFKLSVQLT